MSFIHQYIHLHVIMAIIALGAYDRVRGAGNDLMMFGRFVGLLGMGNSVSIILGLHGLETLIVIALMFAGGTAGWGIPLGAAFDGREMKPSDGKYHRWQVGFLRKNVFAAMVARGIIWGSCLAVFSWKAGLAYGIAFAAAPYLARIIPISRGNAWQLMEFGRGILAGTLLAVLQVV